MKKYLIISLILFLPVTSFAMDYYIDNSCVFNGNGVCNGTAPDCVCASAVGQAGPFNSGSNAMSKSAGYMDGDNIYLKRGQTYRETLTLPAGGSSAGVSLDAYGSGTKPIIKASNLFSTWAVYSGTTYRATAILKVYFVWKDGSFMNKGTDQDHLNNHEWYWTNNVLYYRNDENTPEHHTMEGSVRASCISSIARNYWNIKNLTFMHTNALGTSSSAIYVSTSGDHINISHCNMLEAVGVNAMALTNSNIDYCLFDRARYNDVLTLSGASQNVRISYSKFLNNDYRNIVTQGTSTDINIYNCIFDRYGTTPIYNTSSGSINAKNIIIAGGTATGQNGYAIQSIAGIFNLDHSLVLPDGRALNKHLSGVTEGAGNLYDQVSYANSAYEGIITFGVDDTAGVNNWDDLTHLADEYGFKIGIALNTNQLTAGFKTTVQNAINRGHWIGSHTRDHAILTNTNAFNIQYIGSAEGCTMTIDPVTLRLTLTTTNPSTPADDLNIDLTSKSGCGQWNGGCTQQGQLCKYINEMTGKYTCTVTAPANEYNRFIAFYQNGTLLLTPVTGQDIKSSVFNVVYDPAAFYNTEINLSMSDLSSSFTAAGGGPYVVKSMIYPYGPYNDTVLAETIAAGYLGARGTEPLTTLHWKMADPGINLYKINITDASASIYLQLDLENNANDSSAYYANHFTGSNVTYSNATYKYSFYSALLNGNSSYFYKTAGIGAGTGFDFSRGDYTISAWVRPISMSNTQTVYYQGTDANNYNRLYIGTDGAVHYEVWSNNVKVVNVDSAAGVIAADSIWRRINLKVELGTYTIYCDTTAYTSTVVASAVSASKPVAYTGTVYIGCGYDWRSSIRENFFAGYMDFFVIGNGTYFHTMALLHFLTSNGGMVNFFLHKEYNPLPIMRMVFDACKNFKGRIRVMAMDAALDYIRGIGTPQADGQTWIYNQPDGSDYRLLPTSSAINKGADVGMATDFDGVPIRKSGHPNIGCHETWQKIDFNNDDSTKLDDAMLVLQVLVGMKPVFINNTLGSKAGLQDVIYILQTEAGLR